MATEEPLPPKILFETDEAGEMGVVQYALEVEGIPSMTGVWTAAGVFFTAPASARFLMGAQHWVLCVPAGAEDEAREVVERLRGEGAIGRERTPEPIGPTPFAWPSARKVVALVALAFLLLGIGYQLRQVLVELLPHSK